MSGSGADSGVGRCDITGCYRDAIVTFRFTDGEGESVERDLCLPCRRVVSLSARIPWGDTSETWHDREAYDEFHEAIE